MRRLLSFGVIGACGTLAYLGAFLALHGLGPQTASLLARALIALPTSWLNARITFRSRVPLVRAYAAGLGGMAVGAVLAAAVLLALHDIDPHPSRAAEVASLAGVQILAAAVRFAALRAVSLPADAQPSLTSRRAA